MEEGAEVRVGAAEAGEEGLGQLGGGDLAGEEGVAGGEYLGLGLGLACEGGVGDGL